MVTPATILLSSGGFLFLCGSWTKSPLTLTLDPAFSSQSPLCSKQIRHSFSPWMPPRSSLERPRGWHLSLFLECLHVHKTQQVSNSTKSISLAEMCSYQCHHIDSVRTGLTASPHGPVQTLVSCGEGFFFLTYHLFFLCHRNWHKLIYIFQEFRYAYHITTGGLRFVFLL